MHPHALVCLLMACSGDPPDPTDGTDTVVVEETAETGLPPGVETGAVPTGNPDTGETPVVDEAPNYAARGPHAVTTADGTTTLPGCQMRWTRFTPDVPETSAVVLLSHGFIRSRGNLAGWADHLASWGIEVVTPDLCHSSLFDTDHAQNGVDLQALGAALAPGADLVYAGQSAGGLASVLAAAGDAAAITALGLDPVDADGLGEAAAPALSRPVAALIGDPSSCNASNNSLAMLADAPDATLMGVPGADHCSFESPTDIGCTLVCGNGGPPEIADTIRGMSTAWILWRTGTDARGAEWWTPGEGWYTRLEADGRIEPR